jgi:hypothetical protein
MTRAERLKLAKAARELASEFAEGRGPELVPWTWCGCACAKVVERAGFNNAYGHAAEDLAVFAGDTRGNGDDLISMATRHEASYGDTGAVVFPLLWLADELVRHD